MSADTELQLIRLQARVASLEAAVRRRSEELRHLQQRLPAGDLAVIEQIMGELAAGDVRAFAVENWRETFLPVPADLAAVLEDLWRSTGQPSHRA